MQNYNPYATWDDFVCEHNEVAQMIPEHIVAFDKWIASQTEKPKHNEAQGWLDVNVKPKKPFRRDTITKLINISALRVMQSEFKEVSALCKTACTLSGLLEYTVSDIRGQCDLGASGIRPASQLPARPLESIPSHLRGL